MNARAERIQKPAAACGALGLCLFGFLAPSAQAEFQYRFDPVRRAWSLKNGAIEAAFRLTERDTFELERLADLRNGDQWTSPAGVPASPVDLEVGGAHLSAETRFRLVGHSARSIDRRAYRQTIVLEDAGRLGLTQVELELYEGQPVLRYRVRFRSMQPRTVAVQSADMLPWTFAAGQTGFRALRVNQWVAGGFQGNFEVLRNRLEFEDRAVEVLSGAQGQHCTWLALRDDSDRGLFAGWEFDGRAAASVKHLPSKDTLRLSATIEELDHPLESGQEFEAPFAFLGLFHGDWDEAGYFTRRFADFALARPAPDGSFPYVIWNSRGYGSQIDELTLRRDAELAAGLGAEVFVADFGWAKEIGDWRPDPVKFPRGLRPLSDYVHGLGMRFGLHLPLAEASPSAPVLL
jgi:hypothetical protein